MYEGKGFKRKIENFSRKSLLKIMVFSRKEITKRIEERSLREFQRKYHHYSQHIPDSDNTLEWLSLMRHYGAPTRLLDFTYSFYVAAYFGTGGSRKRDCAVWAINVEGAVEKSKAKFTKGTAL